MRLPAWILAAALLVAAGETLHAQPSPRPDSDGIPRVTPDGDRIAYVCVRQGSPGICVMRFDGSDDHRVSAEGERVQWPAWSPDGEKVTYAALEQADGGLVGHIIVVNADGTGRVEIAAGPGFMMPAFSPDGREILYSAGSPPQWMTIHRMNVDGTGAREVVTRSGLSSHAVWSPDGRRIAFVWTDEDLMEAKIYVADADGSSVRQVSQGPGAHELPAWSPDGERIAFHVTPQHGHSHIAIVNADGTDQHRIEGDPNTDYRDETPWWLPDGRLLIQSDRTGRMDLYVMDPNTGQSSRLRTGTEAAAAAEDPGAPSPEEAVGGPPVAATDYAIEIVNRMPHEMAISVIAGDSTMTLGVVGARSRMRFLIGETAGERVRVHAQLAGTDHVVEQEITLIRGKAVTFAF